MTEWFNENDVGLWTGSFPELNKMVAFVTNPDKSLY